MTNIVFLKNKTNMNIEVESTEHFIVLTKQYHTIKSAAFQAVDLSQYEELIFEKDFEDCLFLGCKMSTKAQKKLIKTGTFRYSYCKIFCQQCKRGGLISNC